MSHQHALAFQAGVDRKLRFGSAVNAGGYNAEHADDYNQDEKFLRWSIRWVGFTSVLIFSDATAALAAPKLAGWLIGPAPTLASGVVNWLAYGGFTVGFMLVAGLYAAAPARAPLDHAAALLKTLIAAHVVILLRLALLRTTPTILPLTASIVWAATAFGLGTTLILAARCLIAPWWRRTNAKATHGSIALVIAGPCDHDLRARLDRLAGRGLGYLFAWGQPQSAGLRMIADVETFAALIRAGTIADILVFIRRTDDAAARRRVDALLASLADQPVRVRLAFDAVAEIGAASIANGQGLRIVTVLDRPIRPGGAAYKRVIDLLGAIVLLALTGPLMAAIALLIAPSGPILFRQRRVGRDGNLFTVLKFRTMRSGADQAIRVGADGATIQARRGDQRITKLGAVLRRLSIDELPQIFNILRGDMSLVGPRPHAPQTQAGDFAFEQAIAFYGVRHRIKPGLTGLAQVRGLRGPTSHPDVLAARVAADLDYIERWSPSLDLAILLRTIPAVIGGRNAC
jgi:exopolysaccharide biosynthesis polyprenyl glycosylphosphotransferase